MRNPNRVHERAFYYVGGTVKALTQKIQRKCQPLGETSIHSARIKKLIGKTTFLSSRQAAS